MLSLLVMAGFNPGHPRLHSLQYPRRDARDTWREDTLRAFARARRWSPSRACDILQYETKL